MDLNRKLITSDSAIVNTTLEKTPLINNNNTQDAKSVFQSWKRVIAELRGPQRLWSTTLIAFLTSLTALLGGYTLGYPSSALLDLNDLNDTRVFRHGSGLENIFGVSTSKYYCSLQCYIYLYYDIVSDYNECWVSIYRPLLHLVHYLVEQ